MLVDPNLLTWVSRKARKVDLAPVVQDNRRAGSRLGEPGSENVMAGLPRHARELNELLLDYPVDSGVMWLSQFDGFVAGLLVCPDMIVPSVWLPVVMGGDGGEFPDLSASANGRKLLDLLMKHYDAVATALEKGTYSPIFDYRAKTDETFWEIWMEGFTQAMALSPDSWSQFEEADDELIPSALTAIMILAAKADPEWLAEAGLDEFDDEAEKEFVEDAPDIITESVFTLYDWTHSRDAARIRSGADIAPTFMAPRAEKVGRNEPCPCGSGKKYKKCCGPKDAEALAEFMRNNAA